MTLTNELIAKTTVNYEKTIAVLTDDRPGFDKEACKRIINYLRDNNYFVHEVTAEELCNKTKVTLGFFLLIPHASSVPAMCAEAIRLYWEQGGQVITLGGTLFSKWIEKEDGKCVEMQLSNNEFDAAYSGKTAPIVIEGIVPSYKTFHYNIWRTECISILYNSPCCSLSNHDIILSQTKIQINILLNVNFSIYKIVIANFDLLY